MDTGIEMSHLSDTSYARRFRRQMPRIFATWIERWRARRKALKNRHAIELMNDHMLRDIGLLDPRPEWLRRR